MGEKPLVDENYLDEKDWSDFSLDPRIVSSIQKLKWKQPTLVQSNVLPLAMAGKDVLVKAKTGSGKTAAYLIPLVQRILTEKEANYSKGIKALVLVPTVELAEQVEIIVKGLCHYCSHGISFYTITSEKPAHVQVPRLKELPDILIATPGRLLAHINQKNVNLSISLKIAVIDEADLILTFGYQADIENIKRHLPKIVQGFMMSATLSTEVKALQNVMLHNPTTIDIAETLEQQLKQLSVSCPIQDKYLLIYIMLRMKLVIGKSLIFVNDISRCFQLKLFLEKFGISTVVLNSELPATSRDHILKQFNLGKFDILIATDVAPKTLAQIEEEERKDKRKKEDQKKKKKKSKVDGFTISAAGDTDSESDSDSKDDDDDDDVVDNNNGEASENVADIDIEGDDDEDELSEEVFSGSEFDSQDDDDDDDGDDGDDGDDDGDDGDDGDDDDGNDDDDDDQSDGEESDDSDDDEEDDGKKNNKPVNTTSTTSTTATTSTTSKAPKANGSKNPSTITNTNADEEMDKEYGVARGIDFVGVSNVINFDFPYSVQNYVHRVGRTARAGTSGLSMSFVDEEEIPLFEDVKDDQRKNGCEIIPYIFKSSIVDGFRYRVEQALADVKKGEIKRARVLATAQEILNSDILMNQFSKADKERIEHRQKSAKNKKATPRDLTIIPDYLMPSKHELDQTLTPANSVQHKFGRDTKKGNAVSRQKFNLPSDPLQSFVVKKRKFSESQIKKFKESRRKKKRPDKAPKKIFKPLRPKAF